MPNNPLNTDLVDSAIRFAVDAHAGTERRGKGFPYILHPLEAASIVASITSDPELLAAAVLHDTVEDADVTPDVIRGHFGDRVASLVEAESDKFDPGVSEEDSWFDRKQSAIDRLKAASTDAKIVALGDKLSNMRAICRDYRAKGDDLWGIFHIKDRVAHEWHYRGLAASLSELGDTDAYKEFKALIDEVFGKSDFTPELIDLGDYERTGEGFTAEAYTNRERGVLVKLYRENMARDLPGKELALAQTVLGLGIPTPKPLRLVTDGKRVGTEFEVVRGKKSFSRLIADDPSGLPEVAKRFAGLCRQLHSVHCGDTDLPDIKDVFRARIAVSKDYSEEQKKVFYNFIDQAPDGDSCIHGDLQIGNVITDGVKDYFIDLPDFSQGYYLWDLAMFCFLSHVGSENLSQFLFHLSCAQVLEVWNVFTREYFGSAQAAAAAEEELKPYVALTMVHLASMKPLDPRMREFIDNVFFNK